MQSEEFFPSLSLSLNLSWPSTWQIFNCISILIFALVPTWFKFQVVLFFSRGLWITFPFYISLTIEVLMTLTRLYFIYFPRLTLHLIHHSSPYDLLSVSMSCSMQFTGILWTNAHHMTLCKLVPFFLIISAYSVLSWWLLTCLFLDYLRAPVRSHLMLNDSDVKLRCIPPQKKITHSNSTTLKPTSSERNDASREWKCLIIDCKWLFIQGGRCLHECCWVGKYLLPEKI
jgi:hypothetical protein